VYTVACEGSGIHGDDTQMVQTWDRFADLMRITKNGNNDNDNRSFTIEQMPKMTRKTRNWTSRYACVCASSFCVFVSACVCMVTMRALVVGTTMK